MSAGVVTTGACVLAIGVGAVAAWRVGGHPSGRIRRALVLLGVLAGFFPLFAWLAADAAGTPGRGILVLAAAAALFRLMNRVESS